MASQQQPAPWLEYTEYRDLELKRTLSNHRCSEVEGKLTFMTDDSYEMVATLASKSMGNSTQLTWTDMRLPVTQERVEGTDTFVRKVEGTLTLLHSNPVGSTDSTTTVTLVFDGEGYVTVNGATAITDQELLDKSKPATQEP